MNSLLTKVLGHHLAHKLVHQWVLFMHKNASNKIVYVLPSFLAGSGVGYWAARYKADPTILQNIFKLPVEPTADDTTTVNTVVETDEQVKATEQTTTETSKNK